MKSGLNESGFTRSTLERVLVSCRVKTSRRFLLGSFFKRAGHDHSSGSHSIKQSKRFVSFLSFLFGFRRNSRASCTLRKKGASMIREEYRFRIFPRRRRWIFLLERVTLGGMNIHNSLAFLVGYVTAKKRIVNYRCCKFDER